MKHSTNYIHETDESGVYLAIELLVEFSVRGVKEGCGRPVYDVEILLYSVVEIVAWIDKVGSRVEFDASFEAAAERVFRDALRDSRSTREAVEEACIKEHEKQLSWSGA